MSGKTSQRGKRVGGTTAKAPKSALTELTVEINSTGKVKPKSAGSVLKTAGRILASKMKTQRPNWVVVELGDPSARSRVEVLRRDVAKAAEAKIAQLELND